MTINSQAAWYEGPVDTLGTFPHEGQYGDPCWISTAQLGHLSTFGWANSSTALAFKQ
jgi:hypothetical protein